MEVFLEVFPFNILFLAVYLFPGRSRIKPVLIEISIYFLKVLVRRREIEGAGGLKKKERKVTFFTGNFTHSHPLRRRSLGAAWNEIRLRVFECALRTSQRSRSPVLRLSDF